MYGVCQLYNYISLLCTAEGEEAPPPGGWTDVQDADLPTAMAQRVADIVSVVCRKILLTQ